MNDPNIENNLENSASDESFNLREQVVNSYAEFEASFRKQYPIAWWGTLLAPVVATAAILLVIGLIWGFDLSSQFLFAAIATFFLFGRFVIILGGDASEFEGTMMENVELMPSHLFAMLTYMDFISALFVTFHMGFLFRTPWIGPRVSALVWDGKYLIEKNPWVKRIAFLALILFVIFPSSTTGSIGGSIFGRLLGFGRLITVAGVLIGSLIGNGVMLYLANILNKYVDQNTLWVKLVGVGVILLIGVFLGWRYQKIKKKFIAAELAHAGAEAGADAQVDDGTASDEGNE